MPAGASNHLGLITVTTFIFSSPSESTPVQLVPSSSALPLIISEICSPTSGLQPRAALQLFQKHDHLSLGRGFYVTDGTLSIKQRSGAHFKGPTRTTRHTQCASSSPSSTRCANRAKKIAESLGKMINFARIEMVVQFAEEKLQNCPSIAK
eukprot:IDg15123t1